MRALKSRRGLLLAGLALAWVAAGALPAQAGPSGGYLGVMLQDIRPSMAKALRMGDRTGVLVTEVVDDSPADEGGLEDGDVILEFDGEDIVELSDLVEAVQETGPGTRVKVLVLREGKEEKLKVEVGEKEEGDFAFNFKMPEGDSWFGEAPEALKMKEFMALADRDRGYLGVELDDLGDQLGDYFGVEDGEGALVTKVYDDSPADEAGMKAGDVIVRVGDKDVESVGDLLRALHRTEPGDEVKIEVVREGDEKTVTAKLGEAPEDEDHVFKRIMVMGDDGGPHVFWGVPDPDDPDVIIQHKLKDIPHVEILRDKREKLEAEDMVELHKELDKLRKELDKLRQEMNERK